MNTSIANKAMLRFAKEYAVTMFAVINTNEPIGDSP